MRKGEGEGGGGSINGSSEREKKKKKAVIPNITVTLLLLQLWEKKSMENLPGFHVHTGEGLKKKRITPPTLHTVMASMVRSVIFKSQGRKTKTTVRPKTVSCHNLVENREGGYQTSSTKRPPSQTSKPIKSVEM